VSNAFVNGRTKGLTNGMTIWVPMPSNYGFSTNWTWCEALDTIKAKICMTMLIATTRGKVKNLIHLHLFFKQ
jgi:hypothetical protein